MMRRIGLLFIILLIGCAGYAEAEIQWYTQYDKALAQAERLNRNMFVLITAPSWCGPCQMLESDTLIDPKVVEMINSDFVALRVLDQIDGKRNPELTRFDFQGFPTIFVYNQAEEPITSTVGYLPAERMLQSIQPYSDPDYDPAEHFLTFRYDGGSFRQITLKEWVEKKDGSKYTLREVQRDQYIYLFDPEREAHFALPEGGGETFISEDQGQSWEPYEDIAPQ